MLLSRILCKFLRVFCYADHAVRYHWISADLIVIRLIWFSINHFGMLSRIFWMLFHFRTLLWNSIVVTEIKTQIILFKFIQYKITRRMENFTVATKLEFIAQIFVLLKKCEWMLAREEKKSWEKILYSNSMWRRKNEKSNKNSKAITDARN